MFGVGCAGTQGTHKGHTHPIIAFVPEIASTFTRPSRRGKTGGNECVGTALTARGTFALPSSLTINSDELRDKISTPLAAGGLFTECLPQPWEGWGMLRVSSRAGPADPYGILLLPSFLAATTEHDSCRYIQSPALNRQDTGLFVFFLF